MLISNCREIVVWKRLKLPIFSVSRIEPPGSFLLLRSPGRDGFLECDSLIRLSSDSSRFRALKLIVAPRGTRDVSGEGRIAQRILRTGRCRSFKLQLIDFELRDYESYISGRNARSEKQPNVVQGSKTPTYCEKKRKN